MFLALFWAAALVQAQDLSWQDCGLLADDTRHAMLSLVPHEHMEIR